MIISGNYKDLIRKERSMSEARSSDAMKNLVKFMICLAIAGIIIALAGYFVVDLPMQHAAGIHAPLNCMWSQCY